MKKEEKEAGMQMSSVNQIRESQCIGCRACETVCPAGAIQMKRNAEGFVYPAVTESLCIECGKCIAFCPALNDCGNDARAMRKIFAARCLNEEELLKSSSGGMFGVMAQCCIQQKGVVYGVAFDKNFRVQYIRGAEDGSDIDLMQGSKYVDAVMPKSVIKSFLDDVGGGRNVLFSGTSCQIAGMKAICRERKLRDDNVWWVDFYECSGKVSQLLWEDECKACRKKGMLEAVSFRDKANGWKTSSMYQRISGKDYRTYFCLHRWGRFLGNDLCRRQSCLNCRYSGGRSGADISIGDFWSRIPIPKKWKDNKGLSIVQVNTAKGNDLFHKIKPYIDYRKVDIPDNLKKGKNAVEQSARRKFWSVYRRQGYTALCRHYASITWKDKLLLGKIRPFLVKAGLR